MDKPNELTNQQTMLSLAARDGIKLALITLVTMSICSIAVPSFVNTLVWIIQTVASIWLLNKLMREYKASYGDSNFGYGFMVCVFSSIITAVYAFASYQWLFPLLQTQLIETIEQMKPMMNDMQMDAIRLLEDNFAQYYCISTFLKNTIFGLIASSFISSFQRTQKKIDNNEIDEL